jgi:hypothetical protein
MPSALPLFNQSHTLQIVQIGGECLKICLQNVTNGKLLLACLPVNPERG